MKIIFMGATVVGLLMAGGAVAADKPALIEMPALAKKNNCTACHAIYKRVVGPAWLDVSKKYKGVTKYSYAGKEYPLLDGLMVKVSKGGAGSFGSMPMIPVDTAGTKQADIKELVTFVLGLEKAVADKEAAAKKDAKK